MCAGHPRSCRQRGRVADGGPSTNVSSRPRQPRRAHPRLGRGYRPSPRVGWRFQDSEEHIHLPILGRGGRGIGRLRSCSDVVGWATTLPMTVGGEGCDGFLQVAGAAVRSRQGSSMPPSRFAHPMRAAQPSNCSYTFIRSSYTRRYDRRMRGVNKVILIGNATRDAELRHTQTGKPSPSSAWPPIARSRARKRPSSTPSSAGTGWPRRPPNTSRRAIPSTSRGGCSTAPSRTRKARSAASARSSPTTSSSSAGAATETGMNPRTSPPLPRARRPRSKAVDRPAIYGKTRTGAMPAIPGRPRALAGPDGRSFVEKRLRRIEPLRHRGRRTAATPRGRSGRRSTWSATRSGTSRSRSKSATRFRGRRRCFEASRRRLIRRSRD